MATLEKSGHEYRGPENRRNVSTKDAQATLTEACRTVANGRYYEVRQIARGVYEVAAGGLGKRVYGKAWVTWTKDRKTAIVRWEVKE